MKQAALFDREIRSLLDQSLETLELRFSADSKKKEILHLKRYKSLYEKFHKSNLHEEFYNDFKNLFKNKKSAIIKSLDNDAWLKKGEIIIQHAENIPEFGEKCADMRICLSFIYRSAIELQESAQKTIGELSSISSSSKDLIRPSILLLHLLRLFYAVSEYEDTRNLKDETSEEKSLREDSFKIMKESDQESLKGVLEVLETDLQVKNRTIQKPTYSGNGTTNTNMDEGFKNVYSAVANIIRDTGIEIPSDVEVPSFTDFTQIIGSIINDPKVADMIQNVGQVLNPQNNNGNMIDNIKNLATKYLNPNTINDLQNTILKTANPSKESLDHESEGEESD